MTTPIGLSLLFLMAVAPLLPWRKASTELLRQRLHGPAWAGAVSLAVAVAVGARGLAPLVAFGLAGFAAASALRHVATAVRRNRWRGLVGRTNGGMIVHVGVVLIAVAFAAASSYGYRGEARLRPGESATLGGHRITYEGRDVVQYPNRRSIEAAVRIDGGRVYRPALSTFPFATQAIGTPSVRTSATQDVYLTLVVAPEDDGDEAVIGVAVQPMVVWLWVGGGVIALGTILSVLSGPSTPRKREDEPVARAERVVEVAAAR